MTIEEDRPDRTDLIINEALAAAADLLGKLDLTCREKVIAFSATGELYQFAVRVYEQDNEARHRLVAALLAAALAFANVVERGLDEQPL